MYDHPLSLSFGVGQPEPPARYDLTQTSPVTSEHRSLVGDLRVREVSYVLSPMYNVSVGAVDSSTPLVTPLPYPRRVVNPRAYQFYSTRHDPLIRLLVAPRACPLSLQHLCFFLRALCYRYGYLARASARMPIYYQPRAVRSQVIAEWFR